MSGSVAQAARVFSLPVVVGNLVPAPCRPTAIALSQSAGFSAAAEGRGARAEAFDPNGEARWAVSMSAGFSLSFGGRNVLARSKCGQALGRWVDAAAGHMANCVLKPEASLRMRAGSPAATGAAALSQLAGAALASAFEQKLEDLQWPRAEPAPSPNDGAPAVMGHASISENGVPLESYVRADLRKGLAAVPFFATAAYLNPRIMSRVPKTAVGAAAGGAISAFTLVTAAMPIRAEASTRPRLPAHQAAVGASDCKVAPMTVYGLPEFPGA